MKPRPKRPSAFRKAPKKTQGSGRASTPEPPAPPRPAAPSPQSRHPGKPAAGPPRGRFTTGRPKEPPAATPPQARRTGAPAAGNIHVAGLETLSQAAIETAQAVEAEVFGQRRRADRAIANVLRGRRDLAIPDHRFVAEAVFALFRWHGWVDPLHLPRAEERLLLSWLLDAPTVHPVCRVWARRIGRDPDRLIAVGDAPNWTARAEGLKRWVGGRAVNADPWLLFPDWVRDVLPLPPGHGTPKARTLEFLDALQRRPPLWVRAQGPGSENVWNELREAGLSPWIHRKLTNAARLPHEVDVYHTEPFTRGALEIQDLASQAVGLVCDPDPGDRWWDACAGAGGKSLHLAALMNGRGVVVATDSSEGRLKEAVRRARRSPFRNISAKPWDGKHVAGKPGSFDGVLVDAPCSAIGTWRRNPDARWSLDPQAVGRLAELQGQILTAAAQGVKPGGTLVYSVCTVTPAETTAVVRRFLETHPAFQHDPFVNPFDGLKTEGTLQVWPQSSDTDAMFIARMVRAKG